MNLGICPMASSSSGNCFLVRSNRTYILLDAGISSAAVKKNLEMMDVQFWEMNGVVLTHEHIDHVRSVSAYCHRSTRQHFFATEGTFAALEEKGKGIPKERVEIISPGSAFSIFILLSGRPARVSLGQGHVRRRRRGGLGRLVPPGGRYDDHRGVVFRALDRGLAGRSSSRRGRGL